LIRDAADSGGVEYFHKRLFRFMLLMARRAGGL
jgi:hypothetical protein